MMQYGVFTKAVSMRMQGPASGMKLYICPVFLRSVVEVMVPQSYPTLCDLMDCSPPGSSVHGLFQARILEWVAIHFSRGSSRPRNRTWVSRIGGRFFTSGRKGQRLLFFILASFCYPEWAILTGLLLFDLVFKTLPLSGKKKKNRINHLPQSLVVIFDQILASRYWSIEITPSEPVEGNVPEVYSKIPSLLTAIYLPAQPSLWDIWELSK